MKDFIWRLLDRDAENRLGANGVEEVKQHKWFEGFDFEKLLKKELPAPYIPQIKLRDEDF